MATTAPRKKTDKVKREKRRTQTYLTRIGITDNATVKQVKKNTYAFFQKYIQEHSIRGRVGLGFKEIAQQYLELFEASITSKTVESLQPWEDQTLVLFRKDRSVLLEALIGVFDTQANALNTRSLKPATSMAKTSQQPLVVREMARTRAKSTNPVRSGVMSVDQTPERNGPASRSPAGMSSKALHGVVGHQDRPSVSSADELIFHMARPSGPGLKRRRTRFGDAGLPAAKRVSHSRRKNDIFSMSSGDESEKMPVVQKAARRKQTLTTWTTPRPQANSRMEKELRVFNRRGRKEEHGDSDSSYKEDENAPVLPRRRRKRLPQLENEQTENRLGSTSPEIPETPPDCGVDDGKIDNQDEDSDGAATGRRSPELANRPLHIPTPSTKSYRTRTPSHPPSSPVPPGTFFNPHAGFRSSSTSPSAPPPSSSPDPPISTAGTSSSLFYEGQHHQPLLSTPHPRISAQGPPYPPQPRRSIFPRSTGGSDHPVTSPSVVSVETSFAVLQRKVAQLEELERRLRAEIKYVVASGEKTVGVGRVRFFLREVLEGGDRDAGLALQWRARSAIGGGIGGRGRRSGDEEEYHVGSSGERREPGVFYGEATEEGGAAGGLREEVEGGGEDKAELGQEKEELEKGGLEISDLES